MTTSPDNSPPVALVTGGSRGIGAETVCRLAGRGYRVMFTYQSNKDAANATLARARSMSPLPERESAIAATHLDVRDPDACGQTVASATDQLGQLNCVVANAGITSDAPLIRMDTHQWSSVIDTNLTGTYNICRPAAFQLAKARTGSIILISSIAGIVGNRGQTNYAATKAGIVAFGRSLAKELGRSQVRVNSVVPGLIATDMFDSMPEQRRQDLIKGISLGRIGTATEVADTVVFLASRQASYITGAVIHVDGGVSL